MSHFRRIFFFVCAASLLFPFLRLEAQVTTATLYGVVRDSTGAVAPAANVTAVNQGTGLTRAVVSDEHGEFALPALPAGRYTLKIELPGFKSYTNEGLQLGAGETVRHGDQLGLPLLKNRKGVLPHALGAWQVSALVSSRTGVPLRVTQPSGIANSRPDFVGGNPVLPGYGATRLYLNKAAFGLVPTYPTTGATIRPGTENPSQVHGPGVLTVNTSLGKTFSLRERVRLEMRADWLNAFNHVNYNNPNATINSPIFGALTSDAGPRTGQIGARLTF
jgi:hypothetical protein